MGSSTPPEIRVLDRSRAEQAAAVLAAAFQDDPVYRFVEPDDALRASALPAVFEALIGMLLPGGHVEHIVDDEHPDSPVAAVIGVLPPRQSTIPIARQLVALPRLVASLRWSALVRAARTLHAVDGEHPTEPLWYVSLIGVAPAYQGKGLGRTLLDAVIARADADGVPTYLETAEESNLAYYRRFGFDVVGRLDAPGGGPPIWRMSRPRGAARIAGTFGSSS